MPIVSLYDPSNGLFDGRRVGGSAEHIARNTPAGMAAWPGEVDHLRWRLDQAAGQLVPWLPPQPADTAHCTWQLSEAGDAWVPVPTDAALAEQLLTERNRRLAATDWTDTASAPARLGAELYDRWQCYRQALRDLPSQPGWPRTFDWPVPPA